jgi:hypothetical protein
MFTTPGTAYHALSRLAVCVLSIAALFGNAAHASIIAYDNPTGLSQQNFGNLLGLEFQVNQTIDITALGAFDNGIVTNLDGVTGAGVQVGIFSNATQLLVGSAVSFNGSNFGTQINGDAFQAVNFTLSPGVYWIVALNDDNYNTGGPPNTGTTVNTGGGAISFIGTGRYGSGPTLIFPDARDVGAFDHYDAGTFQYSVSASATDVPEPASMALLGGGFFGLMWARRRQAL